MSEHGQGMVYIYTHRNQHSLTVKQMHTKAIVNMIHMNITLYYIRTKLDKNFENSENNSDQGPGAQYTNRTKKMAFN